MRELLSRALSLASALDVVLRQAIATEGMPFASRSVTKVVLRLIRAQYNRALHPEEYTKDNPHGLYRGPLSRFLGPAGDLLQHESNVWLDLTAYDQYGRDFLPHEVAPAELAYRTELFVNDGSIIGYGANADGEPKAWTKNNPTGGNISEAVWDHSKGFTTRVHLSAAGDWVFRGSVLSLDANELHLRVA